MQRSISGGRLSGSIRTSFKAHQRLAPSEGPGTIPIEIEATFEAAHEVATPRPGRIEVKGHTRAKIRTPSGEVTLAIPGKWHEQSGDRPRFAPAITHLNVQGEEIGLIACNLERGDFGFAWRNGNLVKVSKFMLDPIADRRSFGVVLEDGSEIGGEAEVRLKNSRRVEGQERPG